MLYSTIKWTYLGLCKKTIIDKETLLPNMIKLSIKGKGLHDPVEVFYIPSTLKDYIIANEINTQKPIPFSL